jgi:V8-like Glu-specific endopeptidase
MNRIALACVLFAAACGHKAKPNTNLDETHNMGSGTTVGSGAAVEPTPAPPPDPTFAARKAYADPGGMWLPRQMLLPQHLENFKAMGVALDPAKLSDPLSAPLAAVVQLSPPGCTGSFVSGEGLIVTNHHCVQPALQLNATPANNIVENGFLAKTKADEPSAGPAQRVMVAQAIKDVTADITTGLDAIKDPLARKKEVEKRQKDVTAACEKDRPGIRCQLFGHFRGAEYQLVEYLELRDLRLVYVPARSVGDYGGEIDNWAWPRHTGDFSFMRAYVSKDGKPADYSADNVPFQPKVFLKVSTEGVKDHDFVMVTGYPGRTSRVTTATETHHDVDDFYPYLIDVLQARYDVVAKILESAQGDTVIKATVAKQSVQNGLEKYQGILAGMKKGGMLQRKDDQDAKVRAFVAQPGHEAQAKAIGQLDALLATQYKTWKQDFDFVQTLSGSKLLTAAFLAVRMSEERPKKDADRKPGFQDRDMSRILGGQKAFGRDFDRSIDRATFRMLLIRAAKLPVKDRPWLVALIGAKGKAAAVADKDIDAALDALYAGTKLEDETVRINLITKATGKELKASKDPFVKMAVALWPAYRAKEDRDDRLAGDLLLSAPVYAAAMRDALDGNLSPDANSSLRVTYGTVKSLEPDDTAEAAWPITLGKQILAKDTGKEPFNAPPALLAALKAKNFGPYLRPELGDLPVNFLSDVDITGGNSGSPTLNGKGELVGLAFDGNTEGLASDVVFNPAVTRTIHCDVRYMLWVMDAIDQADNVLAEMGVKPVL